MSKLSNTHFPLLRDEFSDRTFRETYVARRVRRFVAYQLRALREDRGFSQQHIAEMLGMKQSAVSRIENPEYGRQTISTLLKAAAAYDVALIVRFATHNEFASEMVDLSPKALAVKSYDEARALSDARESIEAGHADTSTSGRVVLFPTTAPRHITANIASTETVTQPAGSITSELKQCLSTLSPEWKTFEAKTSRTFTPMACV